MSTSSAYPERLLSYGSAARSNATALSGQGSRLSYAIQSFLATAPDPDVISGVNDWGQELTAYAKHQSEIGQWVHDVGVAFKNADHGRISGRVTVDDKRLNQLVARADPTVRAALRYFRHHLGADSLLDGDRGSQNGIVDRLRGLSPEQIDEFLAALSNQDLQRWNKAIPSSSFLWYSWGLDSSHRLQLANLLFSSASAAQLARVERFLPTLQPDPKTRYLGGPFTWQSLAGIPLFRLGPGGKPVLDPTTDINQGDDGDCWVLSGLGAIAMVNPTWLQQHIHANANGTYTVTLYQDGKPVQVTVTDTVPADPGTDPAYASTLDYNDKWVPIYEKAYAQLRGGYQNIDGGFADTSMSSFTGQPGSRVAPSQTSLQGIQDLRAQGYAVAAATLPNGAGTYEPDARLVAAHEYMVKSVDVQHQTMTLLNPWGHSGAAPEQVTLSWSEFQKYGWNVSYLKVPGAA